MIAVSTVRNVCQPHESCHFTNLDAREQANLSKADCILEYSSAVIRLVIRLVYW